MIRTGRVDIALCSVSAPTPAQLMTARQECRLVGYGQPNALHYMKGPLHCGQKELHTIFGRAVGQRTGQFIGADQPAFGHMQCVQHLWVDARPNFKISCLSMIRQPGTSFSRDCSSNFSSVPYHSHQMPTPTRQVAIQHAQLAHSCGNMRAPFRLRRAFSVPGLAS